MDVKDLLINKNHLLFYTVILLYFILHIYSHSDIWGYITDTLNEVKDLTNRVQQTKDNVEKLKNIMATWANIPLFERKEKQDNLLGLNDRPETVKKRYAEITSAGLEVLELMEVIYKHFLKLSSNYVPLRCVSLGFI